MKKESTKVTLEIMYMPHHKSATRGDACLNSRCSFILIVLQLNRAPIAVEQSTAGASGRNQL